ncbi:MAG: hypothetical protein KBD04_02990 [Proteobacteria bacterium]|nr:hypothetical protein [Pseudomonadota bacterium]
MFKKCLYFFLSVLFLQNACFADTEALRRVNQEYMDLMLGTEGILPKKATPEQINQMIDGCITAGIVDRLHNFPSKEAAFRDRVRKFDGYKKLDVELAYAFYMLGYTKKQSLGVSLDPNFDREFSAICDQVSPKGVDILEYTNRLEDVIKRTSKPLRFDDFVEVRAAALPAPRAASPTSMGTITPVTTISRSSMITMRPKANAGESALYKKLQALGIASNEIKDLLGDYTENYVEADVDVAGAASASLSSLALPERYYTNDEIEELDPRVKNAYRKQREPNDEGILKTPLEVRTKIKNITQVDIPPKYEGK